MAWFDNVGTAPDIAEAVMNCKLLNAALGTAYTVEDVLEWDDEYIDQLMVSAVLAGRAIRYWSSL